MRLPVLALFAVFAAVAGAAAQPQPVPATCREGPPETAVAACTTLLERKDLARPVRVLTLINRGLAHGKLRDLDSALVDFDAAITLDPKSAAAHNQRGIVLRMRGEYELAVESYGNAIRLQPQVAVYYTNRGIAYRWMRDFDKAVDDLEAGNRINPNSALNRSERALIYRLKLDFPRALAEHASAIRLAPNTWQSWSYRAFTYEAQRDYKAALADFRKAQSLNPRNEVLTRGIARMEAKLANAPPAAQPLVAQQTPLARGAGQRIALVIGNSRYSNTSPLINPKNDAEAVSKAFRAVGFNQVTLKLDLSREQLAATLKDFAAAADRADWAVIYFAGHGIEVGGNNYLVPVDAKFASDRDVSFEAVTLDQVLQSVEGASKLRLVILDACRDNPFARKMTRSAGTRSIGKGLGNIEPEGATLVAYAAKHGQTADDGASSNSPFAASLVRHMQTPGLEINLVFRRVRDEVMATTGKRQEPFTYGSLPSEAFYFQPK